MDRQMSTSSSDREMDEEARDGIPATAPSRGNSYGPTSAFIRTGPVAPNPTSLNPQIPLTPPILAKAPSYTTLPRLEVAGSPKIAPVAPDYFSAPTSNKSTGASNALSPNSGSLAGLSPNSGSAAGLSPNSGSAKGIKSPMSGMRSPIRTPGGRIVMTPKERFRVAGRKVIAMHRSTTLLLTRGVGAEPGVDPSKIEAEIMWGHVKEECVIEVIDYSTIRHSYGKMTNLEFVRFMEDVDDEGTYRASARERWVRVRWINIAGLSWDVVKAVAVRYNLHPLALEDVFHARSQTRSKADYYKQHLFLRVLVHELGEEDGEEDIPNTRDDGGHHEKYDAAAFGDMFQRQGVPSSSGLPPSSLGLPRPSSSGPPRPSLSGLRAETGILDEEYEMDDQTVFGTLPRKGTMGTMGSRGTLGKSSGGNSSGENGDAGTAPPRTLVNAKGDATMLGKAGAGAGLVHRKKRSLLPTTRQEATTTKEVKRGMGRFDDEVNRANRKRQVQEVVVDNLKKGDRVNVKVSPMFIFLLKDGTIISIHTSSAGAPKGAPSKAPSKALSGLARSTPSAGLPSRFAHSAGLPSRFAPSDGLTAPLLSRITQRDSMLRTGADPSMLVQGLVDLVVDKALEVISAYHTKIMKFEREVLLRPDLDTVRNLHILSGDLILHKRTLEPLKTVVYGLRRYDLDRAVAAEVGEHSEGERTEADDEGSTREVSKKVKGYMSHKSQIYLADVYDHMEYVLTSLDMFAGIGENLIDYTFNMKSYEMNEVMRQLTLATIIFLPLTLLTGYFGMNFESMWSLRRSDLFFWILALPIMAIVIPMFMFEDLKRVGRWFLRRLGARV
ncbi:cora-like Mg2+ transporter protein-domain-containing protein [Mycena floridula]|nr:cora-like Mg2+ transporter protein-domain-containing protein [Mycena floridula]